MDAEYYNIDEFACKIVDKAKEGGHRICSIGTTTMRAMETSFTVTIKLLKPSEDGPILSSIRLTILMLLMH
jgi:S-adenosylmethionine:tRNA ribosyltransferase-isomerase